MDPLDELSTILSAYIDRRDNFKKTTVFDINRRPDGSITQISQFSNMVNDFHLQLFGVLPRQLTLAQVEALSELVNSHLNWMRNMGKIT